MEMFTCPRRGENYMDRVDRPFVGAGRDKDSWREGGMGTMKRSCDYCGSAHPDDFMEAVRNHVEIGPTDKAYKFYLGRMEGKFYTPHLSPEQGWEFTELRMNGRVNWGYPYRAYVRLFLPGPSNCPEEEFTRKMEEIRARAK